MFGDFFLVEREGAEPVRGERLAFGDTNGRNEAWLRDTLFAHPELLPVNAIDPAYGPLTPLCTELRTAAGPLDIAFINPFGRLTLVECKLWRNPQSRREVVAQVGPLLSNMIADILSELPAGTEARPDGTNGAYFVTLRDWDTFPNEEAKQAWMWETLNAYVNVFRPLLKRLAAQSEQN